MTEPAVTLAPDTPVRTLALRMRANQVASAVITEAGDPVGIVTEQDLVRLVADGGDPDEATARDVMSQPVLTVEPAANVEQAVERMVDEGVRRLAVVLEGELKGVLSVADVAYAEPELARRARENVGTRWAD